LTCYPPRPPQCSACPGICGEWWPKRKGEGHGETKVPKAKVRKRPVDEDTLRVDDIEVERQLEELMRMEEEAEEGPPEAYFGIDEDDIPEAESSVAATRREPAQRCKGG
jgi:hypothetical protein